MLQPEYVSPTFEKVLVKELMWRFDFHIFGVKERCYIRYPEGGDPIYHIGLTGLIGRVPLPTDNNVLETWRTKMIEELGSAKEVDTFVESTADYGTLLHEAVGNAARTGLVDWGQFRRWAHERLKEQGFKSATTIAVEEAVRDFAALLQFFHDYNVEVLAVELPVWSKHGFATMIDFVVIMDEKKYDKGTKNKSRVMRALNLKSGKKGFYDSHLLQMVGEQMAFSEVYPNLPQVNVGLFSPKNWRESPTYSFKDVTETIEAYREDFALKIHVAKTKGLLKMPEKVVPVIEGTTDFGKSVDVKLMSYESYLELQKESPKERRQGESGL